MNEHVRGHHSGADSAVFVHSWWLCVCLCVYAPSTIHPLNAFPALNSSFGLDKSLPTNYIMAAASKDIAHGAARHIITQFVTPCLCSQWKVAAIKRLDVGPVGAAVSLKLMLSQLRNLGQIENASHPPQNSKGLTAVRPTSIYPVWRSSFTHDYAALQRQASSVLKTSSSNLKESSCFLSKLLRHWSRVNFHCWFMSLTQLTHTYTPITIRQIRIFKIPSFKMTNISRLILQNNEISLIQLIASPWFFCCRSDFFPP